MRKDNQKTQQDGNYRSAEDKAMERFVELMVDRIQTIQGDWKKPWFTESAISVPRNLNGRQYNGLNSVMLMLHCQKNNYELPVFCTFDRVASLNYTKDKQGVQQQVKDGNGENLPRVSILKGERSFPVFITTFSVVNPETKERIKYDDYRQMSEEERKQYNVYPKLQVYSVFNVAQTNLKEARPELYAKLEEQSKGQRRSGEQEGQVMPAVDAMIKENGWYCPIKEVHGDDAYYSIGRDEIVLPERSQFKDLESFQTNLFHEAAHSTGSENRLNRLKPATFGSKDYAAEELKAELTAAFVAANYGMVKSLKEDSAPYLKSWLNSLHESPDFLKTILLDVKKASSMLTQRIDGINQRIEQGLSPVAEEWKAEHEQSCAVPAKAETVAAKAPPQSAVRTLTEEEIKTRIEKVMQQYYYAARFDNGMRMIGFTEHEGKPAMRLSIDNAQGESSYIVTHEQDDKQNDHFFLRLMDGGKEVGQAEEMPRNRDAAYEVMRNAVKGQAEYEVGKQSASADKGQTFYASVAYLQSTDDTKQFDKLKDAGDYKGLLNLAKEYYDGNGMDEEHTYKSPCQNRLDDLLVEDKDFAVVYNASVGGTYEVFLKCSEQEVRDHITRYGIERASEDVKEVARKMESESMNEDRSFHRGR